MIYRFYKTRLFCMIISLIILIVIADHYLSSKSSVPKVCIVSSHVNPAYFQEELFRERLVSYNLQYPDSFSICNKIGKPLNDRKNRSMHKIFGLLRRFRKKIIPYPIDYFNGRGIVLTSGPSQLKYARVNLKMLELSRTRLPVQVRPDSCLCKSSCLMYRFGTHHLKSHVISCSN